MTDYIKREDCIKRDEDYIKRKDVKRKAYDLDNNFVIDLCDVNLIPSADVAPVRHGRWVYNQDDMTLTCGYCGAVYRIDDVDGGLDFLEHAHYCITCGAKMDEEEDDA